MTVVANCSADALRKACAEEFGITENKRSCSHFVCGVIRRVFDSSFEHRNANGLVGFFSGETSKWFPVSVDRGYELANNGIPVVGGLANPSGSGHVVVIYPGNRQARGGYLAKRSDGKVYNVERKGLYPLVASTSSGSWPGAISLGDKTVWDPWGRDSEFPKVKFWAPRLDDLIAQADKAKAAGRVN